MSLLGFNTGPSFSFSSLSRSKDHWSLSMLTTSDWVRPMQHRHTALSPSWLHFARTSLRCLWNFFLFLITGGDSIALRAFSWFFSKCRLFTCLAPWILSHASSWAIAVQGDLRGTILKVGKGKWEKMKGGNGGRKRAKWKIKEQDLYWPRAVCLPRL